jgi:ABC-type polysaccharide/polyol phosphate transport system ATPase subunit
MSNLAIDVRGLSKRYRLGESGGYLTLRETLSARLTGRGKRGRREILALRDVNLRVNEGDSVGVIGRNGAGKTTLLRILARITEPTVGLVRTRGRVGALLEVGTGFHPELTGRENVFLNGSVLGMSRRDITEQFDEIADFSGLERFLDTPLKRYSAGMRVRLAFAVAAYLNTPIIVVDEVLAAGDAEFQRKCLGKMSDLGREGRTVLFVSHDLGSVTRLCDRAIWLDSGTIVDDGPAADVITAYLRSGLDAPKAEFLDDPEKPAQLTAVAVADPSGRPLVAPTRDRSLTFRFRLLVRDRTPGLDLAFDLVNQDGTHVLIEGWSDTKAPEETMDEPGVYEARVDVPPILAAGDYVLRVWIGTPHETFLEEEILRFQLHPRLGERAEELDRSRAVAPVLPWTVTRVRSPAPTGE